MRVSLFGLSPWRINLVNPYSELIQLVLSIFVFIACLIYLSHVYLYLSSQHRFLYMLSDSDLSIYMYLLDFGFTVVPLISFMLVVFACTCMLESHHLIMYTCDCLSTPTGFVICTRRVAFWQPWIPMSRSWSLDRDSLDVPDQSGAAEAWISSCLSGPSFFQPPLIGSRDSHLTTREYFPVFHIVHPTFALLGDLMFLIYCNLLCDNCVLVLLLLECMLPLCFRTLILTCTDA